MLVTQQGWEVVAVAGRRFEQLLKVRAKPACRPETQSSDMGVPGGAGVFMGEAFNCVWAGRLMFAIHAVPKLCSCIISGPKLNL